MLAWRASGGFPLHSRVRTTTRCATAFGYRKYCVAGEYGAMESRTTTSTSTRPRFRATTASDQHGLGRTGLRMSAASYEHGFTRARFRTNTVSHEHEHNHGSTRARPRTSTPPQPHTSRHSKLRIKKSKFIVSAMLFQACSKPRLVR